MYTVDLFAGPGGWDLGARTGGGVDPLGIELDPIACQTRQANGLQTIQADLLDPSLVYSHTPEIGPWAMVGSPPCQPFSSAGQKDGQAIQEKVHAIARQVSHGPNPDRNNALDPDTAAVLVPWAWLENSRKNPPTWIALEQVRSVLPIWEAMADHLRVWGFQVWTGLLDAANYGVPQHRVRAFLLARNTGGVLGPPEPTHSQTGEPTLFAPAPRWTTIGEALQSAGLWKSPDLAALKTNRDQREDGETHQVVQPTEPAPTITGQLPRQAVWKPLHKGTAPRDITSYPPVHSGALKMDTTQAQILQGFPRSYRFSGTRTEQLTQIGNAIPPPLAAAIVGHLHRKDTQ